MPKLNPRALLNSRRCALPLFALALIAALAVGSSAHSRSERPTCGPTVAVRDPGLRASFARFDREQSAAAGKVCTLYRDLHSAAPLSGAGPAAG